MERVSPRVEHAIDLFVSGESKESLKDDITLGFEKIDFFFLQFINYTYTSCISILISYIRIMHCMNMIGIISIFIALKSLLSDTLNLIKMREGNTEFR